MISMYPYLYKFPGFFHLAYMDFSRIDKGKLFFKNAT